MVAITDLLHHFGNNGAFNFTRFKTKGLLCVLKLFFLGLFLGCTNRCTAFTRSFLRFRRYFVRIRVTSIFERSIPVNPSY